MISLKCLTVISMTFMLVLAASTLKTEAASYLKDSNGRSIYLAGYGPYSHIFAVGYDYASLHTELKEHHVNLYRLWPLHGFYKDEDIISGKSQLVYTTNKNGKCDLTSFNQEYWNDLKGLLADAESNGIYVEISLFDDCSLEAHHSQRWTQHPFNKRNNTNGVFDFGSRADSDKHFYNLENNTLLYYQELYVKKLINETWSYSNVIYEIINEGDAGEKWIKYWVNLIDREFDRHTTNREPIIAHNAFPFSEPVYSGFDNPDIDVINWHAYAVGGRWEEGTDPELIQRLFREHYGVKPQNYDEGANLPEKITYQHRMYARRQIWSSFVNGGYVNIKDGRLEHYVDPANYVDKILLDYFKYFGKFRENLNFGDMIPYDELVRSSPSGLIRCDTLANPGEDYLTYITGNPGANQISIEIALEEGLYLFRWFDPEKGEFLPVEAMVTGGRIKSAQVPEFSEDVVFYATRISGE